ncbi:hypothetical protein GSI_15396 [Ganoderma sinense ZZ0214-1]|uniref:RING-type domain-containing protein n=1 Tax=Ganoderma sinense ZZ0214-1 TaxID=1077348 RepID=A0A2G8RMG6_9APHY|nr:hypothetical protein GSI_15396 [Ganoderma sinense ZZ0214-1]
MDRDNRPNNNGFFHHLLDPHLGEAIGNLVRGLLPQHQPQPQPADQSSLPSSGAQELSDLPLPEPTIRISQLGSADVSASSESGTATSVRSTPTPSSSNTSIPSFHATTNMSSPQSPDVDLSDIHEDTTIYEDNHDVEMVLNGESGPSQPSQTTPASPDSSARSTRRARVDDEEEDEDALRASNRQRRHSRTLHHDEHRFMPIPEDHGVPHPSRDARAHPEPNAPSVAPQPPQQGPAPPPQLNGMTWTFDFIPIRGQRPPANAQAPEGGEPATGNADHRHNHPHGQHQHGQGWNFFINFQNPGEGPAPQPGTGGNQGSYNPIFASLHYFYPPFTDGGNQPGPGFPFPFPPFVFPFGMDFLEQRDDPERAQRLVKGLEEVPVGLVKRMERAGGPGTGRGQVPTCAVCWEGLLDPEGGGFEGNVELAKAEAAEAAEAAREEAASQQGRDSSANVDDITPTMESSAGPSSSSSQPSQAEEGCSPAPADGDSQQPKIVVLPCAHAFHATCLLPWFSKPGRTTCPSCRFDIDPDSLTYKPPPMRPLRANPPPQTAPAAAAGPQPEGAPAGPAPAAPPPPIFFGGPLPPPPPEFFQFPAAPQPPPAPVPPPEAQNAPNPPHAAPAASQGPQPEEAQNEPGQQRQPLPPFVTFDISMIIPIYPGRNGGAPPPNNGGAQVPNANANANATAPADPQGPQAAAAAAPPPPPPPPRTDNNGFRLDDTLLQEAVRTTFERLLGRPLPPFVPHPPPQGGAAPGDNNINNNGQPQWFTFSTGPLPGGFPPMPPLNMGMGMGMGMPPPAGAGAGGAPRHRSNPRRPVEKRPWAPPPAPGPTLRQVVERNEREMGLRCSDVSCGLGPSDEEPEPAGSSAVGQVAISAVGDGDGDEGGKPVCEHTFHSACLVSAERVAGWGQEVADVREGGDVEVSCPVCRAHGVISREKWEEGACALA